MTLVKLRIVAAKTGLSLRHWQRQCASGTMPWAREVQFGARRTFLVDEAAFDKWWQKQVRPCQKISASAVGSGGSV